MNYMRNLFYINLLFLGSNSLADNDDLRVVRTELRDNNSDKTFYTVLGALTGFSAGKFIASWFLEHSIEYHRFPESHKFLGAISGIFAGAFIAVLFRESAESHPLVNARRFFILADCSNFDILTTSQIIDSLKQDTRLFLIYLFYNLEWKKAMLLKSTAIYAKYDSGQLTERDLSNINKIDFLISSIDKTLSFLVSNAEFQGQIQLYNLEKNNNIKIDFNGINL